MLTADTITAEQIHELHQARAIRAITAAHAIGISYPTHVDRKPTPERQRECREFCAAVYNDRVEIAEFARQRQLERERAESFALTDMALQQLRDEDLL